MTLCAYCKDNHPESACPLYAKAMAMLRSAPQLKSPVFQSNPPAPFVGEYGYPHVNIGILAPENVMPDAAFFDDPKSWAEKKLHIADLVSLRASLINSRQRAQIKKPSPITEIAGEVAMAEMPAEIEVHLTKIPKTDFLSLDSAAAPMGPSADLASARVTSNVRVSSKIERVVSDSDLKASEAVSLLYSKGIDETKIMRVLSVGLLGQKQNRKLVPTKWAITATDDTLCKDILTKVRTNDFVNEYLFYQGDYLGNYYFLLFLPGSWAYELFEMSIRSYKHGEALPEHSYDYEEFEGRKTYAANTAGGYYSVRLAVAEMLRAMKRQATVVAIRLITNEYTLPMGVWVTREAARAACQSSPLRFATAQLLTDYVKKTIQRKFNVPIGALLSASRFLQKRSAQRSLGAFS